MGLDHDAKIDTVCVDGKTMTIQEYLAEQEEKSKISEIQKVYDDASSSYNFVKAKSDRRLKINPMRGIRRVLRTKIYTKKEIVLMNQAQNNPTYPTKIIAFLIKEAKVIEWYTAEQIASFIKAPSVASISGPVRHVFNYLVKMNWAEIKRDENIGRKLYYSINQNFKAHVNSQHETELNAIVWFTEQVSKSRKMKVLTEHIDKSAIPATEESYKDNRIKELEEELSKLRIMLKEKSAENLPKQIIEVRVMFGLINA